MASSNAIALFHQHRDHASVHRGANLAVAPARRGRLRRGQRQIANGMREAPVHKIQPVAIAQECCTLHHAVVAEAERVAVQLVDFEPVAGAVEESDITALALAQDLQFVRDAIDLGAQRNRECRGQRSPAPPLPRVGIAHAKQQCREGYV